MKNKGLWLTLGVVAALVLVVGYLMTTRTQAPSEVATPIGTPTDTTETPEATEEDGEVREITVEGDEFSFSPSSIAVSAGETIRLTFKNTGAVEHNLMIDELGVATQTINPGQEDTVTFTVDESGTYTYYCSVNAHRSLGMEGEMSAE